MTLHPRWGHVGYTSVHLCRINELQFSGVPRYTAKVRRNHERRTRPRPRKLPGTRTLPRGRHHDKAHAKEVERLEELTESHGVSRSEFIRNLILHALEKAAIKPEPSPELVEIIGLRLMLTNFLRPLRTAKSRPRKRSTCLRQAFAIARSRSRKRSSTG